MSMCRFLMARGASRAALGFVPVGIYIFRCPSFMLFPARGAAYLPKFPVSSKPLVQGSVMAETPLDWG